MPAVYKIISVISIVALISFPPHAFQGGYTDANIPLPVSDIEQKLRFGIFEVLEIASFKHLRLQANIAKVKLPQRIRLRFSDGTEIPVKWKTSEKGGKAFNNQPRYEVAAYEFQKLFLPASQYVVPPTAIRSMHASQYRLIEKNAKPTFSNSDDVFFVLQYWLSNVAPDSIYKEERLKRDSTYARHFSNMNLFCYLIKHGDSNAGNVMRSTIKDNPRLFAVDNGIAFTNAASDRGTEWRYLKVRQLPASTIERLRQLTSEDLKSALGVVAQFSFENGRFMPASHTANIDPEKGVRYRDGVVQFGLTKNEINNVLSRISKVLREVDDGKLATF